MGLSLLYSEWPIRRVDSCSDDKLPVSQFSRKEANYKHTIYDDKKILAIPFLGQYSGNLRISPDKCECANVSQFGLVYANCATKYFHTLQNSCSEAL